MANSLVNYQWELDGVVFGYECDVEHESDSEPLSYSWRTQDVAIPNRDATSMGRDLIEPGTWNFKLFTNCSSEEAALEALQTLNMAWRGDKVRKNPGEVLPLRYRLNGRTRRVYGRPRRFSAPLDPAFHGGMIRITADFQCVSEIFWSDDEESRTITIRPPAVTGGFTAPFTAPIAVGAVPAGSGASDLRVGGLLPTPAMIDFVGPLEDPELFIDGLPFAQTDGVIPFGDTVTVDARPWVSSVTRADGSGAANLLSPYSRMPDMLLEPGTHSATLAGIDPTGTGHAVVRWNKAYPTV